MTYAKWMGRAAVLCSVAFAAPMWAGDTDNGTVLNGLSLNGMSLNGTQLNGMSLNGMSLNGMSLNGMSLNGMSLNGMSLNGMSLNGMSLNGMSLNGTWLSGTLNGTRISGARLVGTTLNGLLSNGGTVQLRIDAVSTDPTPNNQDVTLYAVSVRSSSANGHNVQWLPLCGTNSAGAPILATAMAGTWNYGVGIGGGSHSDDPNTFTFACAGAGIYKCAEELGYKPWLGLADHHQACTRMLRADYCGDGAPHTIDGTPIDVYDAIGLQSKDPSFNGTIEAEWDENGARCMSHPRYDYLGYVPICILWLHTSSCGNTSHFNDGTLLMDDSRLDTLPNPNKQ